MIIQTLDYKGLQRKVHMATLKSNIQTKLEMRLKANGISLSYTYKSVHITKIEVCS